MASPRKAAREEPGIAALLILGCLLPPGLWLWVDAGRPWWLLYLAWLSCIVLVASLGWQSRK